VARTENLLNDRPRACLGYRTPREVFIEQFAQSRCD
jgi:IS30 family transposase